MAMKEKGMTNLNERKKTKKIIGTDLTVRADTGTKPKRPPYTATVSHISGHVTHRDTEKGLADLLTEAIDKDLNYEQPLGGALTDDQRRTKSPSPRIKSAKAEKSGPDSGVKKQNRPLCSIFFRN